jgi:hypothetical protein
VQPDPVESALVVIVPEAEALVGAWRRRFDPSSTWGVPAHVTVLYPFVAPAALDAGVRARVAALVEGLGPFTSSLAAVRSFGDEVLYLAPDPDLPFRRLTELLASAFPEHPPYGGAFAEPRPHLTITEGAPRAAMRSARIAIEPRLPVACSASEVVLMAGSPAAATWRVLEVFQLRQPAGGDRSPA